MRNCQWNTELKSSENQVLNFRVFSAGRASGSVLDLQSGARGCSSGCRVEFETHIPFHATDSCLSTDADLSLGHLSFLSLEK